MKEMYHWKGYSDGTFFANVRINSEVVKNINKDKNNKYVNYEQLS